MKIFVFSLCFYYCSSNVTSSRKFIKLLIKVHIFFIFKACISLIRGSYYIKKTNYINEVFKKISIGNIVLLKLDNEQTLIF